ncbi:type II toxin-antitoxin system RelE family toxin [Halobellus rubicundus]|uniref:Type II toxin-antitoxin system RelE/ParE family toxin n=1 Tax=Halobellus rubicundus TaxID=2996466 RepID=A0ABD5M9Z0_9EURY
MGSENWSWEFSRQAGDQFVALDPHIQDRIVSKLDEIVDSKWRDPDEFLEPLTGGPFSKLRIGQYRLACTLDRDRTMLEVHRIEHRSGAYTADD